MKVDVWAGISLKGPTEICIFDGTMDADLYCEIIQKTLLPFLVSTYPEQHRFMQDNDPKHASRKTQAFFQEHEVNWWKTLAESPDMNPIENLWQEFIRSEVNPTTKAELVSGIEQFWKTVDVAKCKKYI